MNKYLPPSQRSQKKEILPKKNTVISLNDTQLFPTLNVSAKTNGMSFASVAKYEEPKVEIKVNPYNPGWVYIRRKVDSKHIIEYKYEPQLSTELMAQLAQELKYEEAQHLRSLKSRIQRLQWEQDRENSRLGDLSPFFNAPTIKEELDNAYINTDENSNSSNGYDYPSEDTMSEPEMDKE